ncbi:hypothetical protein CH063_14873, partial [Colletotrichum higginsianum]
TVHLPTCCADGSHDNVCILPGIRATARLGSNCRMPQDMTYQALPRVDSSSCRVREWRRGPLKIGRLGD